MADIASPLVSVVIPCYNATKYIPDALNSLRAQTFRNFEAILVNDGCPDTENLERVLQPYRDEIVYIKSGKWASISGSRNTGINASRARYVSFLDADDAWEPDYLSVLVGMLEADPSIDLVYTDATYFGEGSWVGRTLLEMHRFEGEATLQKVISRECIIFISVTARRESLIRAGLFDPLMRGGEDWDLWVRVLRTGGKIASDRRPLARYRQRKGSMSADKLDLLRNGLSVCEKYLGMPDLTSEERGWWEACAQSYRANTDLVRGKQALYARRRGEAIELLTRANHVLRDRRVAAGILALRLAPALVYSYVHRRYPTEYAYLH
jgi:glycosyltransferase involved in cell wall biosynthesis